MVGRALSWYPVILCGIRTLSCAVCVPYPVRFSYLILCGMLTLSWAVFVPYPGRYAYLILCGMRTLSWAVFVPHLVRYSSIQQRYNAVLPCVHVHTVVRSEGYREILLLSVLVPCTRRYRISYLLPDTCYNSVFMCVLLCVVRGIGWLDGVFACPVPGQ